MPAHLAPTFKPEPPRSITIFLLGYPVGANHSLTLWSLKVILLEPNQFALVSSHGRAFGTCIPSSFRRVDECSPSFGGSRMSRFSIPIRAGHFTVAISPRAVLDCSPFYRERLIVFRGYFTVATSTYLIVGS